MKIETITHNTFYGGISPYQKISKVDQNSSARFLKNLNIHEDPSYITLQSKATKISSTTVVDLPKWMTTGTPWDTNKYAYDASGNIYKIDSSDVVTPDRAGATIGDSAAGQGMSVYNNSLFYTSSTKIGRKGPLDNSPSYTDDYFTDGFNNLDPGFYASNTTASGQTYTTPVAISEAAVNTLIYGPTRDPLLSVKVNIAAKGTGNWTITVHDSLNTVVAAVTVANASLSTGVYTFSFASPIRVIPIADNVAEADVPYHIHITSTVADGTVVTSTASDLSTAYFVTVNGVLIADTLWHPVFTTSSGLVVFGNERYLGVYDGAAYNSNAITFEPGYKVRAITEQEEFLVISCWKGSNIDKIESGKNYFWDSNTYDGANDNFYDFSDVVTLGLPNAVHNSKNRLFGIYGSRGMSHLGTAPYKKLQEAPLLARGKKIEIYPGAITEFQGKTLIGMGASTDDASFQQGIYEYGNQDDNLPEVLTLAYTISTGTTQSTSVKIGCVKSFGTDFYIGWRDSSTYGIDKVSLTGLAATTGSYEQLIFDSGTPQQDLVAIKLVITFLPLASGETITPKYRVDRAVSWTLGTTITTVGETRAEQLIDVQGRYGEIEYGFDVTSSSGTYPIIVGVFFMSNDNKDEAPEGGP